MLRPIPVGRRHQPFPARSSSSGQSARAREKAKAALGSARGGSITVDASIALALAGAPDEARPPLEDVARRFPVNTLYQKITLPTARAAIELQRGNTARVGELLEDATRHELGSVSSYFSIYLRALAHQKAGRGPDAGRGKDADADLAVLREAQAEYSKLKDR